MSTRSARYNTLDLHTPKGRLLSGVDRDAGAFLEAAQIYNVKQQQAIIELVRLLKAAGVWSKMAVIYPFVGGTATTHKWNLKDPRDLDAAYRITWNGDWTHSSTGVKGDGITAYANTFYSPSYGLQNDNHMAIYSRTNDINPAGEYEDMGVLQVTSDVFYDLYLGGKFGTAITGSRNNSKSGVSRATTGDTLGLHITNRVSSSSWGVYKDTVQILTSTQSSLTPTQGVIFIGAVNRVEGSAPSVVDDYYNSPREFAFASIGTSLTATQAVAYATIVQRFQRMLGRAVT